MTFPPDWNPSKPLTVGLEWELQILDIETLKPKPIFERIFTRIPEPLSSYLHAEIYKAMLEIVSPPFEEEEELLYWLGGFLDELKRIAERENFTLVGLGTLYTEVETPPERNLTERYKLFVRQFGELLDDFYIFGIHVHIGFPNPEWALKAYNNFVYYAPLLLALSASSPIYRGRFTGIHSFRTVVFERLPRAELPPQYSNYAEYEGFVKKLRSAAVVDSLKDIWHHVRLRPDLGTVEVRVFDSIWEPERIGVLIRLLKAIALLSETYGYKPISPLLARQNWWFAKRYSLDADFADGRGGRRALKQVAFDLVYSMDDLGIFKRLGYDRRTFLRLLRRPSPAREMEAKFKVFKNPEKLVNIARVV